MYRPKSSLDRKKIPLQTKYPNMYHSWYPSVSNAALIVQRKSKKKKKKKRTEGNRSKIVCRRVPVVNKRNMPGIR